MAITKRLTLALVTEPAEEPVSLTEAKSHLRVDIDDDDTLISSLITAAREVVEKLSRRALVTQTWRLSLDEWPDGDEIDIPKPPLQSVSSITYTDSDDTTTTWSSSLYEVDADSEPGRVKLAYGESWPADTLAETNPIKITFVAGYGEAADVPDRWKQAIKLILGHWYENREEIIVSGAVPKEIPMAAGSLILLDRG